MGPESYRAAFKAFCGLDPFEYSVELHGAEFFEQVNRWLYFFGEL